MKKNISYFADFGSRNRPYTGGYYFAECMLNILRGLDINLRVFSATIPRIDKGESFVSGNEIKDIELPIGGFGNPRVGLKWVFRLKKELTKIPKQDLYIFDQPNTLINFLPKAPAITMFHGSDFIKLKDLSIRHPRNFFYGLFWRRLFLNKIHKKFLTRKIGIPLFNSNDTLNRLNNDFNIDSTQLKKCITYLPVDTEKFKRDIDERNKIRRQYGIADDEIIIMALSNFDPVKRADRLKIIVEKILYRPLDVKVKFLIVGSGRKSEPLNGLMQDSETGKNYIRINQVPHSEVYKFYSAADIALSTSERESFGYFIAEGMSCDLPFVGYKGGAIEEVIDNNKTGFVVSREDDFVEFLLILIKNPILRKQMGEKSREKIKQMFSVPVFRGRFLKILSEEFSLNLKIKGEE